MNMVQPTYNDFPLLVSASDDCTCVVLDLITGKRVRALQNVEKGADPIFFGDFWKPPSKDVWIPLSSASKNSRPS